MAGHRFSLPQPTPAGTEQKVPDDVMRVLREHVAYTAAARAETRQARLELKEIAVKIQELSSKVDTLISVATDIKSTADGEAAQAATIPEDDPEIAALAGRIDEAIAVLQGTPRGGTSPTPGAGTAFDPNAPAI